MPIDEGYTLLESLRDWIDGDHPFELVDHSHCVFLHDPVFTEREMRYALLYISNKLAKRSRTSTKRTTLQEGTTPTELTLTTSPSHMGSEDFLTNLLDEAMWLYGNIRSSTYNSFGAKLAQEPLEAGDMSMPSKMRRTIAALCRLRTKVECDNARLRREIVKHQDEGMGPEQDAGKARGRKEASERKDGGLSMLLEIQISPEAEQRTSCKLPLS
ncbi:hypothetical protein BAUCODRAFT_317563 [Baudoinia panamericana UAMH 10762]|uniref:Uncharacterized protein n=1 Tax=Baudoinia panamericana (strain UAMH 10762) TaxID=717646 RepID=M2MIT2_BAUPA|nr:uncharacterized protein BAUCODRAFT_317563 [Baudoinia panamericana UAMH 10762]EMC91178.1 hypothetical protein BAUCODRAFT_317563 [Baudoinia panamericana UAMH 10762]